LTFLSGSFNRLQNKLQGVFSKFTRISQSALYLKDYFDFIDIKVKTQIDENSNLKIPSEIKEGFKIVNIYFAYPDSETNVLEGVSFEIKKGEKLAFVGERNFLVSFFKILSDMNLPLEKILQWEISMKGTI